MKICKETKILKSSQPWCSREIDTTGFFVSSAIVLLIFIAQPRTAAEEFSLKYR